MSGSGYLILPDELNTFIVDMGASSVYHHGRLKLGHTGVLLSFYESQPETKDVLSEADVNRMKNKGRFPVKLVEHLQHPKTNKMVRRISDDPELEYYSQTPHIPDSGYFYLVENNDKFSNYMTVDRDVELWSFRDLVNNLWLAVSYL